MCYSAMIESRFSSYLRPENIDRWLTPVGRSDADLQNILGERQTPYYEHEVLAA